jgi:hypothetical protein
VCTGYVGELAPLPWEAAALRPATPGASSSSSSYEVATTMADAAAQFSSIELATGELGGSVLESVHFD